MLPSHNSSQGKQFNSAEFSKHLLNIFYVVNAYLSTECFVPSKDLEYRVRVAMLYR